jgi:hypothetical protein
MKLKSQISVQLIYADGIAQFLNYLAPTLLSWPLTSIVQENNFNVKDKNTIFGHRGPTHAFVICRLN